MQGARNLSSTSTVGNANNHCGTPTSMDRRGFGRRRASSVDSDSADPWGWFDDFEGASFVLSGSKSFDDISSAAVNSNHSNNTEKCPKNMLKKTLSLQTPKSHPPSYILESSVETQYLWYSTAGQRPQQPLHEREYFEKLWENNFENSSVPVAPSGVKKSSENLHDENLRVDINGEVMYRGRNPFSNAVSKSFERREISSMTLQVPNFRIVRDKFGKEYAEYLVVVSFTKQNPFTFGVWKRHSDFDKLANQVSYLSNLSDAYNNSLLSWQCVLSRKRWYKCLDKEYLALKCFLLERFVADLLFESPSPSLMHDFLLNEDQ